MIESYAFGRIVIDGTVHTSDVIIYPDGRVEGSWWRREGHRLASEDVRELINAEPEILVVGTGASGLMKPAKEFKQLLADQGITCIALPSKEAMVRYNELVVQHRVGACFHLTC